MYCPHCGRPVDEDKDFCPECGGRLRLDTIGAATPTVPPDETPGGELQAADQPPVDFSDLARMPAQANVECPIDERPRRNSLRWTIIGLVVLIFLCCCCAAAFLTIAWFSANTNFTGIYGDLLNEMTSPR